MDSDHNSSESMPDEGERDMMNMFASVWIKVEVNEGHGTLNLEKPLDNDVRFNKRKKRPPRRLTKTLKCNDCEYTTVYKHSLDLHSLSHSDSKPHCCSLCKYTTKYPTALQRHIIIKHEKEKRNIEMIEYKCDQCPYSSNFKYNLKSHKRKHKQEKQFKCGYCSYATAYRHNFFKHSKTHHKQEAIFKCDKCPFVTKFEGHITRHLAQIHNEVSEKAKKCDFCDFSTMLGWRLNIHKQRSKQNDVLKCLYCDFETHYSCESKRHKKKHYSEVNVRKLNEKPEETSDVQFEPETEGLESPDPSPEPTSAHEISNNYKMDPNCETEWKKIPVIESDSKERPFQCTMCQYTARFKASVQRHFQRHHTGNKVRPYKCVNCEFSTKTKDQISLHNKRSKSETVITCAECSFTTFFKCQSVMHQKLHYAHKCSACSYSCKHKYELQKHYVTMHVGDGLKCRFCEYKAKQKESLRCHEAIHTGNKPYKCSLCDYQSVRKSLLDNHIKRYHSDVASNKIVVSDDKIQSLKIAVGDGLRSQDLVEEIRAENLSFEDILNARRQLFGGIMDSSQSSNSNML